MSHIWQKGWIVASTLAVSALVVLIWKKKKRSFVRVGKISKLLFFPVKSLKAVEVAGGKCTNLGFVVNGLLDRSFMVVNGDGVLVSQRDAPSMVLLTPHISGQTLTISAPTGEEVKVEIKDSVAPGDKIIHCVVHTDSIDGVDCGDEAALFFQSFLELPSVRLVRYFSSVPNRKFLKNDPFYRAIKEKHPIGFQDFGAFHILSQASVDNLNSKLEGQKVSFYNFRPNILVDECEAFEEDSWRYLRLSSGVEMSNLILATRCILTTNDPSTGKITKKEPLVTMRKYRIPSNPTMRKQLGSLPCMGVQFAVLKPGEISVGDALFAVVGELPQMTVK